MHTYTSVCLPHTHRRSVCARARVCEYVYAQDKMRGSTSDLKKYH